MSITNVFRVDVDDLTKYEVIILLARRSREINQKRLELEHKTNAKFIEKSSPVKKAIQELISGTLKYERKRKKEEETTVVHRGPKTIL